ncbi:MAG: hypothetical protein LAT68_02240 [Cyclobacteriaceae bacterium]|nr:hypothetical protein [Cyclobacteriaceae bacterium]MCH8515124.1 hypothetical protein [Cyclobacteriaceae bacterium]
MYFLIKTILIAFITWIAGPTLPWYGAVIVPMAFFIIFPSKGINAFLSGFLGVGLLWLALSFQLNEANGSLLADKMALLFGFNSGNWLILITWGLGGIAGGIGALAGYSARQLVFPNKKKERGGYYSA